MTDDSNEVAAGPDFSTILASSVHDMKNSLGMLLNSLDDIVASTPPANEQQAKQFSILQYEASRINGELIKLLALYRMEKNRLPLHIDEQFVIDMLEEQVARNYSLFQSRNISLLLACEEDLSWYFDAELVGGVLHNILVNCSRYSQKNVKVSAYLENQKLCITVEDDGCGYPQEMLVSIDARSNRTVDFNSGSTNLGLYFAEQVARMHTRNGVAGTILLANGGQLGGGVFKMVLP